MRRVVPQAIEVLRRRVAGKETEYTEEYRQKSVEQLAREFQEHPPTLSDELSRKLFGERQNARRMMGAEE